MEKDTVKISVICVDSQLEQNDKINFPPETGYQPSCMEILEVTGQQFYEEKEKAVRQARGEYILFLLKESQLQDGFFDRILQKIQEAKEEVYALKLTRKTAGKRFFEKMFCDTELDYVAIEADYLKVLRGFLGCVIKRDILLTYMNRLTNGWDESLILTGVLARTMRYGLIDATLTYERESRDFIPKRELSDQREQYQGIFEQYYKPLLDLKEGKSDGFGRYIDTLVTIDIYYKVSLSEIPENIDPALIEQYKNGLAQITKRIQPAILAHEICNVLSANKRTWLLQKMYLQSEELEVYTNEKQAIFMHGNVMVRKASTILATIEQFETDGEEAVVAGRICTAIKSDDITLVLGIYADDTFQETTELEVVPLKGKGEKSLGELVAQTYTFAGRIPLQGDKCQVCVCIQAGDAIVPLEIKIKEDSQAQWRIPQVRKYDSYLWTETEKRYLFMQKNNTERYEAMQKKQEERWIQQYGKEETDISLANVAKYEKYRKLFSKNRVLLVTCKDDLPKKARNVLAQQKNMKVVVVSKTKKEMKGFKTVEWKSKWHRFLYMYARYEWNLLGKYEKYSPFGEQACFYEGIRCAVQMPKEKNEES